MTTGHVFMAMSLDGFVARPDDRLDWLAKQDSRGEDHGFEAFSASIDGIILGRGSFLNVLTFGQWPYEKPVVVMSRSLGASDIPENLRDKVSLSTLEPAGLMASLAARGWNRAYVDGGLVVQSFIRSGLVDDICVTIVPILIGSGKRLFGTLAGDVDLDLTGSRAFKSGMVQNTYRLAAAPFESG